jgi:hypothetical protein
MAVIRKYFVLETTTTQGTGDYELAGALTGFEAFGDRYSNTDQFKYAVSQYDDVTGELINYEVGTGEYVSATDDVQRVSIDQSSAIADAAVDWGVGVKNIYVTQAADDPMIGSNNGSEFTTPATVRSNIGAVGLSDNSTFTGDNTHTGINDFDGRLQFKESESDVQAVSSSSGTATWDVASGGMATITLTENVTTFNMNNIRTGGSYCLRVTQGAGPYTITWPASVEWPGGQEPSLSAATSDVDVFTFLSFDGVEILGFASLDFS